MKAIPIPVKAHWTSPSTTIATCWKATRRDGAVFAFTTHVRPLKIAGLKYSSIPGIQPTGVKTSAALAIDNLELEGAFEAAGVAEADVLGGKWDYAQIEIFEVNYADIAAGTNPVRNGRIGTINTARTGFRNELLGLMHALQQQFGRIYTPTCDAILGDARCGIDLSTFPDGTVTTTITAVAGARVFTASALTQAADWFTAGLVTFDSGANAKLSMEVKSFSSGQVGLYLPMPYVIAIGDQITIKAGCNKTLAMCSAKFSNVDRYRGHPHVPGTDKLVAGK